MKQVIDVLNGCTGYFAHPFEDLQLRLPYLPLLLPHELDRGRNSEFLLTLQRNNTSILREKLTFHHKTRFEKTCGSRAPSLPKVPSHRKVTSG